MEQKGSKIKQGLSDSNKKQNRGTNLESLQKIIHVNFKNMALLRRAMTHRSYINEAGKGGEDNERLEFLGDSVLALVVNEYLFKHFLDYDEGDLAKIKSAVVSEATLSKVASEIGLGDFLHIGRGEANTGGRSRPSILANTMEALIGAVFLDSGLTGSRRFILGFIKKEIEKIDRLTYLRDPKTTLQEYVQKKYKDRPEYRVIEERGPDHMKEFIVKLYINGREIEIGEGPSKRKAEMNAAIASLKRIQDGELDI